MNILRVDTHGARELELWNACMLRQMTSMLYCCIYSCFLRNHQVSAIIAADAGKKAPSTSTRMVLRARTVWLSLVRSRAARKNSCEKYQVLFAWRMLRVAGVLYYGRSLHPIRKRQKLQGQANILPIPSQTTRTSRLRSGCPITPKGSG